MAYLYGEMGEEERRKFDQYLLTNPDAQRTTEEFRNLRKLLSVVEEKEVIAPPIVVPDGPPAERPLWSTRWFRVMMSAAASLVLVILAGALTGARLTFSEREVRLSFGHSEPPAPRETAPANALTEDDVRAMIAASVEKNNDKIQASLNETQRKLETSIRDNLALRSDKVDQLIREASSASQEQIRQYVDAIRAENMEQVRDYFQLTSTEQKKYIENLLVDFAKYLQQQRNDDLRLVQMRMNNLEQNTDMFRQETEQILTSIITTVGVPVSGETHN